MNKNQLNEAWIKTMAEAEKIRLKYDGKPQEMPGDEEERWEKAVNDADALKKKLELLNKETALQAWGKTAADTLKIAGSALNDPAKLAEKKAFEKVLRALPLADEDRASLKAYQADDMVGGGFFVTPIEIYDQVLTLLKDLVFVRQMATVIPVPNADALGVPAMDTDPSDTDWTTELKTGTEETTAVAGFRVLKPNPMAKQMKFSRTLVRKAPNFETVLLDRLAYKVGVTEEKAFLTGNGAEQPLGVFVADAKGISTARDVAAAAPTAIAADDLLNVHFKLKAGYRKRATWVLNRTVLQACRKLKDSNNNYIWTAGIGPGEGFQGTSPTLVGLPYSESEYAPGAITTGQYTAILGDFSFYWIADALEMTMQVLDQLYAATNQIGYILRKETDGQPVLEEAFARLKQA